MKTMRYIAFGPVHMPFSQRLIVVVLILTLLLIILSFAALMLGTTDIKASAVLHWLFTSSAQSDKDISALMQLRAPRIAVAILGGAMMAASGYLLQVVSGNGLADPGLIGISHGTSAAILLGAMVFAIPPTWLPLAGLAGGLMSGIFVLALAAWLRSSNGLILIGLAVGITLGALVEIIMVSGGVLQFSRYMSWSHGSLTAASTQDAARLAIWALLLCLPAFALTRAMAPLALGNEQAATIGISPGTIRVMLTLIAASLVAPVVSVAGPLSFLGLIAAHIARRLVGTRPGEVLVVTMLTGSLLLLQADTAGRTLFLPIIVPAGLIVSVVGVISFLLVARGARL